MLGFSDPDVGRGPPRQLGEFGDAGFAATVGRCRAYCQTTARALGLADESHLAHQVRAAGS